MTLPQYQRKGYGLLMIEFGMLHTLSDYSHFPKAMNYQEELTKLGPLSDLGLRSYLAYWVATFGFLGLNVLRASAYTARMMQ